MYYNEEYLDNEVFNYDYLTQNDICRLCWRNEAQKEINSNKLNNNLLDKINYILDITIDLSQRPNKLCQECFENIEKFNEFKLFCRSSNRKLNLILASFIPTADIKDEIKHSLKEEEEETKSFSANNDSTELNEVADGYDSEDIPLINSATGSSCGKTKRKYTYTKKNYPKTYCRSCSLDLHTDIKLNEHNQSLHGIYKDGFKCFGCDRRFKTRRQRLCHELGFCKGLKNGYLCSKCNRYLPKRRMYERHVMKHVLNLSIELPEDIFKCCKCKKMFKSKESLAEHVEEVHTIKKHFVCEQCGRVFNRMDYLNKHMTIHTGLKKHICPRCGYRATQKSSLNVHMRKHTGDKPFPCDICPMKCLTSSNLIAHKLRHAGVKKYECALCPKKFGYKASLEEHVSSTHDKVKWFTCNICNTSYARSGGLRRHMRAKHGAKDLEDEKEEKKCANDYLKNIEGFNVFG